ncbi:MAG: PKD domain-containing protein [Planctomycetes bacterium]|nr:PKD domain-containing protein [Planctomycetota bacterium]
MGMGRSAAFLLGLLAGLEGVAADVYRQEVLKDRPVAYWRLGEDDLLDDVRNEMGDALNGEFKPNERTGLQPGFPGAIAGDDDTAVRFQTIPGFACHDCGQIQVPRDGALDLGLAETDATITLEAWFKLLPDSCDTLPRPTAFPRIFHYNNAALGQYAFGVVGDDSAGYPDRRSVWAAAGDGDGIGGVIKAAPTDTLRPNGAEEWRHFVATIVGGDIRLFLDGEEITDVEDSDPIYWQFPQATIGGRIQSDGISFVQGFPGLIDELAVYDHVLSIERIQAHHATGGQPTARPLATPSQGDAPLTVDFDGTGSTTAPGTTIVGYEWSFGDGGSATGSKATHTYTAPGRHVATLTVNNDRGGASGATIDLGLRFPEGDVAPWAAADIGMPDMPGGSRLDGDRCLALLAGSRGPDAAWPDGCRFVYQERAGSFGVTARVSTLALDPEGSPAPRP